MFYIHPVLFERAGGGSFCSVCNLGENVQDDHDSSDSDITQHNLALLSALTDRATLFLCFSFAQKDQCTKVKNLVKKLRTVKIKRSAVSPFEYNPPHRIHWSLFLSFSGLLLYEADTTKYYADSKVDDLDVLLRAIDVDAAIAAGIDVELSLLSLFSRMSSVFFFLCHPGAAGFNCRYHYRPNNN